MDPSRDITAPWATREGPLTAPAVASAKRRRRRGAPMFTAELAFKVALAAALAAGSVWACLHFFFSGGHTRYPAVVETAFLASCVQHGAGLSSCQCALNWFESHKSLSQFKSMVAQAEDGQGVDWTTRDALTSCGLQ